MKALLRSARALSALDKLPEALDALARLRLLEKDMGEEGNDVGKKWRDEVDKKVEGKKRREAEKAEKERRKLQGDAALILALTVRALRPLDHEHSRGLFGGLTHCDAAASNEGSSSLDRRPRRRSLPTARPT